MLPRVCQFDALLLVLITCLHTATTALLGLGADLQYGRRTSYHLRLCDQSSLGVRGAAAHARASGRRSYRCAVRAGPDALLAASGRLGRVHCGQLPPCQARNCERPSREPRPEELAYWRRHGWLQDRLEEPGTKRQLCRRESVDAHVTDQSDLRGELAHNAAVWRSAARLQTDTYRVPLIVRTGLRLELNG